MYKPKFKIGQVVKVGSGSFKVVDIEGFHVGLVPTGDVKQKPQYVDECFVTT